jgi:hypothetical protein
MSELLWHTHAAWPLLATLQLLPLLGAAALLRLGERPLSLLLGHAVTLAVLGLALLLYRGWTSPTRPSSSPNASISSVR